jgi:hypothetical protein
MNDANSKITIAKQDERNYGVLAYLGTRPRTTYLGRVRNPNAAMPGAQYIGHTSVFEEPAPGADAAPASGADNTTPNGANGNHVDAIKLNPEKLIG